MYVGILFDVQIFNLAFIPDNDRKKIVFINEN